MSSFFRDNPPIDDNPTIQSLRDAVVALQKIVGTLDEKVDKLEQEVYNLEENNTKLNKRVKRLSSGGFSSQNSQKNNKQQSVVEIQEKRKKAEEKRKAREEKKKQLARNQTSFGGGGKGQYDFIKIICVAYLATFLLNDFVIVKMYHYLGMFFDYDDEDSDDDDGPLQHGLGHDTFSLLKVRPVISIAWLFTMTIYAIQCSLLIMIFVEQFNAGYMSAPFGMPYRVDTSVRVGQLIAVLVTISLARDIFFPIKELQTLWFNNRDAWIAVTGPLEGRSALSTWIVRLLIPNILQLIVGVISIGISFVIIIQSDNVINLFADFAAMSVIAELDNIAFWFAENGYVGDIIMNDAKVVQDVSITEKIVNIKIGCMRISFRSVLFVLLTAGVIAGYIPFAYNQHMGEYFRKKFPRCILKREQISTMGDGICDGGTMQNSIACDFDDGDCTEFNIGYPGCFVSKPSSVGDSVCNQENNIRECKYDGGDCCEINVNYPELIKFLGDNQTQCHGGYFFTEQCLYDLGDCDLLREEYPNCSVVNRLLLDQTGAPIALGNGICDQGKENIREYMKEECGWVFGDCLEVHNMAIKRGQQFPECTLDELFRIGDGVCDQEEYNYLNEQCGWDKFDCCELDVSKIGDGVCDSNGEIDYLTPECGYEGYDCCDPKMFEFYVNNDNCGDVVMDLTTFLPIPKEDLAYNKECAFEGSDCFNPNYPSCKVDVMRYIGDGVCNGGEYNSEECGYDGGDCLAINEAYPGCNFKSIAFLGNGLCDKEELNVPECGFDAGDCIAFNSKYRGCDVGDQMYKVGNGFCDASPYQNFGSEDCKHDGGDCDAEGNPIFNPLSDFNIEYPDCHVEEPNRVGDGKCRGEYNTQECGWDGGDCLELNLFRLQLGLGPDCEPDFPELLANGECNGGAYNTEACGYDAGDCLIFNELYPTCLTNFPRQVGNGICDPDENVEECGWDGGDCVVAGYPDCHAPHPRYIGDGECDRNPAFNNEECGWDGGDCVL